MWTSRPEATKRILRLVWHCSARGVVRWCDRRWSIRDFVRRSQFLSSEIISSVAWYLLARGFFCLLCPYWPLVRFLESVCAKTWAGSHSHHRSSHYSTLEFNYEIQISFNYPPIFLSPSFYLWKNFSVAILYIFSPPPSSFWNPRVK